MERKNNNRIPDNNPSKPMDSRNEVERANDEKINQDFPGYPHYPAKEDIMNQETGNHRVDVDVEKFAGGQNASGLNERFIADEKKQSNFNDLEAFGGDNSEIGTPQNVSNEDLKTRDIPGSDLDNEERKIKE